jgi:hypothetical protein
MKDVVYEITVDDKIIIKLSMQSIEVKYVSNSTNTLTDSLYLLKWNYIKLSIDLFTEMRLGPKIISLDNLSRNFSSLPDPSLIYFKNMITNYQNSSMYIREFRLWKTNISDLFIISNRYISL